MTKGLRDLRTKGPKDQRTKGQRDKRTKGQKDVIIQTQKIFEVLCCISRTCTFLFFYLKLIFMIFVLLSAQVEIFGVSRMRDFVNKRYNPAVLFQRKSVCLSYILQWKDLPSPLQTVLLYRIKIFKKNEVQWAGQKVP